jgi:hypothetical protein
MKLESYEIQTALAAGDTDAAIRLLLANFGLSHRESEAIRTSRSPMNQYTAAVQFPAIVIYFFKSSFIGWVGGKFSCSNESFDPSSPSYVDLGTTKIKGVRYRTP